MGRTSTLLPHECPADAAIGTESTTRISRQMKLRLPIHFRMAEGIVRRIRGDSQSAANRERQAASNSVSPLERALRAQQRENS